MVRIVRLAPVSDDGEIPFEALTPPTLTTELAAALAQLSGLPWLVRPNTPHAPHD
jgi:hypothetical protein